MKFLIKMPVIYNNNKENAHCKRKNQQKLMKIK